MNDETQAGLQGGGSDFEQTARELLSHAQHRELLGLCAREIGRPLGRLCFLLLGSQAEADEATQETLIAAFDAFASFRGEGTLRAFVFGIGRRICSKRGEVRARQQRRGRTLEDEAPPSSNGPETQLGRAQQDVRVRQALDNLKPSDRDALLLRYDSELSFREVAQIMGLDEPAARKRVGRALARLREELA